MKLTKKLFIAIMTMALLVVTFGTSTFAWFTLGSEGKIEDIRVNVTAGTGMEISKDGRSWKNTIELDRPANFTDFSAVTSFDGKTFKEADSTSAPTGKYFEQIFYVRVVKGTEANPVKGVYLKSVTGTSDNDLDWIADVTLKDGENLKEYRTTNGTIEENKTYQFDALNAVKISFAQVTIDNNANVEEVKKVYAFENEATSWGTVTAKDSTSGKIQAGLAYDYAEAKGYPTDNAQPGANESFPTYITKTETDAANAETSGTTAKDAVCVLGYDDFDDFASIGVNLGAGLSGDDANYVYAKVVVRIWLEGWDPDCINAILGQVANISFILKAY